LEFKEGDDAYDESSSEKLQHKASKIESIDLYFLVFSSVIVKTKIKNLLENIFPQCLKTTRSARIANWQIQ
jgi:hypothetical protein